MGTQVVPVAGGASRTCNTRAAGTRTCHPACVRLRLVFLLRYCRAAASVLIKKNVIEYAGRVQRARSCLEKSYRCRSLQGTGTTHY